MRLGWFFLFGLILVGFAGCAGDETNESGSDYTDKYTSTDVDVLDLAETGDQFDGNESTPDDSWEAVDIDITDLAIEPDYSLLAADGTELSTGSFSTRQVLSADLDSDGFGDLILLTDEGVVLVMLQEPIGDAKLRFSQINTLLSLELTLKIESLLGVSIVMRGLIWQS